MASNVVPEERKAISMRVVLPNEVIIQRWPVDAAVTSQDSIAALIVTWIEFIPDNAMEIIECIYLQYSTISSACIDTTISSQSAISIAIKK